MARDNYGIQVLNTKIDKFISDFKATFIISIITSIVICSCVIQFSFSGGLKSYFSLCGETFYYFSASLLPYNQDNLKIQNGREVMKYYWEFYHFYTNIYQIIAVISAFLSGFLFWKSSKKYGIKVNKGERMRNDELQFVTPQQLEKEINEKVSNPKNDIEFTNFDIKVSNSNLRIPDKIYSLNDILVGVPGSGKTNVFNEHMIHEKHIESKCLIVDPNGSFFAKFGKPGDHILSLSDKRSEKWLFWNENLDPLFLANALVEVKETASQNRFFDLAGRAVLASILRIATNQEELWRIINYDEEQLYDVLLDKNELSRQYLGKKAGNQGAGVIASSLVNINFIKYLNHHSYNREKISGKVEEAFSLTKWVENDNEKSWVFLIEKDNYLESAKPLLRLWFDIVTNATFNRNPEDKNLRRMRLFCDEMSTIGNLPSLPLALDRGRKYNAKLILGFQSQSQQEIIFGKEVAMSNSQSLQNIYVFRQNSNKDAEIFSDRLGSSEILETETNVSAGGGHGDKLNLSKRVRESDCVTPSQIQALENNTAFVKFAGLNPTKLEFKYHILPNINKALDSEMPSQTFLDDVVLIPYVSEIKQAEEEEKTLKKNTDGKNIENIGKEKNTMTEVEKKLVDLVTQTYESIFLKPDKIEAIKYSKKAVEMFSNLGSIKTHFENNVYSIYFSKNGDIFFKYRQTEFSLEDPRLACLDDMEVQEENQEKCDTLPVIHHTTENAPVEFISKPESPKLKHKFI